MNSKLAAIAPVFLFAMTIFGDEPKDVSIKTIEAIQRSVVPVICAGDDGAIKLVLGSAFFINKDGYFVTAAHVVMNWKENTAKLPPCRPAIFVPTVRWGERSGRTRDVQVFYFS